MPRVLAIEPNSERGSILRTTLQNRVGDVLVVDSNGSALEALEQQVPDLLLLSALLSPSDEDELFDRLKELPESSHVQTLTIPQLRPSGEVSRRTKFSLFGGRRNDRDLEGCDPEIFAQQVEEYLERATELKAEFAVPSGSPVGEVDPILWTGLRHS